ncbi:MAG: serine/threonine protein kinase [Legionellaceae bacterium]|nr:serine/threonine protein kinase [Legionellaceae bacterium]
MKEKMEIALAEPAEKLVYLAAVFRLSGPLWNNNQAYTVSLEGRSVRIHLDKAVVKRSRKGKPQEFAYDVIDWTEQIGSGAQGTCYLSRMVYRFVGERLVLKHLPADKQRLVKYSPFYEWKPLKNGKIFRQVTLEYQMAARVDKFFSSYGLHVKAPIRTDKGMYLSMRKINGTELFTLLCDDEATQRLALPIRYRLSMNILLSVQACIVSGVLHRDIKPENFLANLEDGRVWLCDYGFSRPLEQEDYRVPGTLAYAAPELVFASDSYPDEMSECYSLGRVLFLLWGGSAESYSVPNHCAQDLTDIWFYHIDRDSLFTGLTGLRKSEKKALYHMITALLEPDHRLRMSAKSAFAILAKLYGQRYGRGEVPQWLDCEPPADAAARALTAELAKTSLGSGCAPAEKNAGKEAADPAQPPGQLSAAGGYFFRSLSEGQQKQASCPSEKSPAPTRK